MGTRAQETRRLLVGPDAGQEFPVAVPTHLSVLASFERGGQAQSLLSFDTPLMRQGFFEVNGTEDDGAARPEHLRRRSRRPRRSALRGRRPRGEQSGRPSTTPSPTQGAGSAC